MVDFDEIVQDLEMKRVALLPPGELPVAGAAVPAPGGGEPAGAVGLRAHDGAGRDVTGADIAAVVGEAVGVLSLAGDGPEGVRDAAGVSRAVINRVLDRVRGLPAEGGRPVLGAHDLSTLVEAALIEIGEYPVARALVLLRGARATAGGDGPAAAGDVRLIRRGGQVVSWNGAKVERAVRRAFLSLREDPAPATEVAGRVTERVRGLGTAYIAIETVQDMVQEDLVRAGHMRVAERYIVYRAERALLRAGRGRAGPAPAAPAPAPVVELRGDNGRSVSWDGEDLRARMRFAAIGLDLPLRGEQLEAELRRGLHAGARMADMRRLVVMNARALVERDSEFARFAGRMLLTFVYEETLGWDVVADGLAGLARAHRAALRPALERGAGIGRIDPALLEYDLDRLAAALDPTADLDFDYLGIQTLYDRYLMLDRTGDAPRRLEAPQVFWMRVAMGVCLREDGDREARALDLYAAYKERRFCSSTPTLFNAGTPRSQLSSCYLYVVDDSLESIMQRGIAENAMCSKWAGGLGGSWTRVRGTGSHIAGTNGESQGVVPFLKLHNDQLVAVNQGGKRAGSGCAYLETWHNDIRDFLELRRGTGDDRRRTHDMNTANWIPDLFMKRVEAREHWTLFRSSDVPDLHDLCGRAFEERYTEYESMAARGEIHGEALPAIDLWKQMLRMLFETGHPWITFKDACNVRSPQDHAGVVHSSNLCTEITLNTSAEETAVCNLGSVLIDRHLTPDGEIDHERLRSTVRVAVRALDDVIDVNYYPTEAARTANMRHRPVGLGVMGLHHALHRRGVSFASQEAVEFSDEMMEAIAHYAYEASSDLAAERGAYPSYAGSKWDRGLLPQDTLDLLEDERGVPVDVPRGGRMDWGPLRARIARQGMRNSNVLAIAPTATIANIMGTSPCIEPLYKNLYTKSNLSGEFVVLNPLLVADLKAAGAWSADVAAQIKYFDGDLTEVEGIPPEVRERHRTAFQIAPEWLIDAAARRQKWIDQSQSLNLFLAAPDMRALSHMYRRAWRAGLKTTYYLRTMGASGIDKATLPGPPAVAQAAPAAAACFLDGEECEACQ